MTENEQIKEMAVVLSDGGCKKCDCDDNSRFDCKPIYDAELLYKAGYRKVRHGTWRYGNKYGKNYAECTACGLKMDIKCYGYAYCPLCGARMDGDRRKNNDGE